MLVAREPVSKFSHLRHHLGYNSKQNGASNQTGMSTRISICWFTGQFIQRVRIDQITDGILPADDSHFCSQLLPSINVESNHFITKAKVKISIPRIALVVTIHSISDGKRDQTNKRTHLFQSLKEVIIHF